MGNKSSSSSSARKDSESDGKRKPTQDKSDDARKKIRAAGVALPTAAAVPTAGGEAAEALATPAGTNSATKKGKPNGGANKANKAIDLAFVLDTTGSMGSYIDAAQRNIKTIVARVHEEMGADVDVRFALVSYKDYDKNCQQLKFSRFGPNTDNGRRERHGGNGFDDGSAARVYSFTADVASMQQYVDLQRATGGGDGPEAVATALHCADELLEWREDEHCAKIAVLISDAPPHGLEPAGGSDNYPNGDPQTRDVLEIARALADKDVTLYSVACEPSVTGSWKFCRDFMEGLAEIGGGMLVPLKSAEKLTDMILASCKEGADLAEVQAKVQAALAAAKAEEPKLDHEGLARRAAEKLAKAGVRVNHTRDSANAYAAFDKRNVTRLKDASSLRACKGSLERVSAPRGWDRGLSEQRIRSEVASISASQCSRMMTKHARKSGWGY